MDLLAQWFPSGKRHGHEFKVGSIRGERGESLSICLDGSKMGVWSDFATGDGGDLIDLWAKKGSVSVREAIKEVRGYLGISSAKIERPERIQWVRPKLNEGLTYHEPEYLHNERKLTHLVTQFYHVSCAGNDIVFPYYRDGELIMIKYLSLHRENGKKKMRVTKDTEPCLFGWNSVSPDDRKICITEGEIDAMTMYQYRVGMGCLSVPFGGGSGKKQAWIETEYDRLATYDEIFLCMDDDAEGREATKTIMERLGRHRCRIVRLPYKDANECLKEGVTREQMLGFIDKAESTDPKQLRRIGPYENDTINLLLPDPNAFLGYTTPWEKHHRHLFLRPDELSLWTGINGHGKSQILGHVLLDCIAQGAKVCIASLEIKPHRLLGRMVRQAAGIGEPSREYIQKIFQHYHEAIWIFECVGTTNPETILEVFKYARQRYGIDIFVIDSLMKCGFAEDDYNGQKKFIDQLCAFKNDYNCHVHLVVHPRKSADETNVPGKLDMKGSGAVSDLADNCFTVWRNKKKEDLISRALAAGEFIPPELQNMYDCLLRCDKQRNGDWEGTIPLWFDRKSLQYLGHSNERPKQMVN
jgi:twinkle protein